MRILIIALLTALAVPAALAHHPLDGMPMQTLGHGLLSGIGHPLLGFDHLFFVVLVGIASSLCRRRFSAPFFYLAAMLAGCLLTSTVTALPATELLVALSLLTLGLVLASGRSLGLPGLYMMFAGFGLFHGAAFGGSLAAQEAGFGIEVLLGYLVGLGLTQYAIAIAAGWGMTILGASSTTAPRARLAGAMVAGAGLLLTLEQLEGPLLQALFA